jgi:hypothetical protein
VLSSLWVAAIFGPLLYSVLSPTDDLWAIVHALQGRGVPPSKAAAIVQKTLEQGGLLGRAIHVGHYAGGSVILQNNASHTMSKTEDSYIAWFQKIPKPILLAVRRYKVDGALQAYEIGSGEATSFLVRAYAPPLLAWAVSLYLVSKRRSPLLNDPAS